MSLEDYARKRRFPRTPEPPPSEGPEARGSAFCVQRHHARQAHYDLRLEHAGALLSWAVPQGPTLDPSVKRLAVRVEDHPLDYASFEGVIPAGNYGAGSVMLFDTGHWRILAPPGIEAQLARGDLKFELAGQKLRGSFALVRTGRKARQEEWLLLKKPDAFAIAGWNVEDFAWSASTGRSQHEIEAGAPARDEPPPALSGVMLAERASNIPAGADWSYEVKWDGVRSLAFVHRGQARLMARSGTDITARYPELASLPSLLRAPSAILDGEIAVCDEHGRPRFELIQPRIHASRPSGPPAVFFAFDLLWLDGRDLRGQPLRERRRMLEDLLVAGGALRFSESFSDGASLLAAVKKMGLEGVMAKRLDSPYRATRGSAWLKIKQRNEDDFYIAGFVRDRRDPFGSLLLVNEAREFAGSVGTGFRERDLRDLHARLKPLESPQPAIDRPPRIPGEVHWVRPELRCRVRYLELTPAGRLRAPVYLGLSDPASPASAPTPDPPRGVRLTNPAKLLFPEDNITKRDLAAYYDAVAPLLLPHLAGRPLTLLRYPDGIHGESFFQKDVRGKLPPWFPTVEVEADGGVQHLALCDSREALLHLANLACIDLNPWMSRAGSLDHPDFLLIDLDPHEAPYSLVIEAALRAKVLLDEIGLRGFPKTTGGNGLHIYIPLAAGYSFDHTRAFAEALSRVLARRHPKIFTLPRSRSKREKNRVYFDWQQNGRGKSISAPYVVRPRPGAHVATPLDWAELRPTLTPAQFHLRNAPARFQKTGDLFQPVLLTEQVLEPALERFAQVALR